MNKSTTRSSAFTNWLAYLDLSGNLVEQFDLHPEIVREIVPNEEGDGFTKGYYINVPECVPAAVQYHLYVNLHGVSYVRATPS